MGYSLSWSKSVSGMGELILQDFSQIMLVETLQFLTGHIWILPTVAGTGYCMDNDMVLFQKKELNSGIGKVSKVLIPLLFVIMAAIVVFSPDIAWP